MLERLLLVGGGSGLWLSEDNGSSFSLLLLLVDAGVEDYFKVLALKKCRISYFSRLLELSYSSTDLYRLTGLYQHLQAQHPGQATVCSLCTAITSDLAKNHKKVSMSSSAFFTLFLQGHCCQLTDAFLTLKVISTTANCQAGSCRHTHT